MKTKYLTTLCLFFLLSSIYSGKGLAQSWGLKTNAVNWAVGASPNLEVDVAVGAKYTVGLKGGYNWFWSKEDQRLKHWMVRPEVRYWLQEPFRGHSFALQGLITQYNVGGVKLPFSLYKGLKEHRYEGMGYGLGLGYSYLWRLGTHSGIEVGLGLGYIFFDYDKYKCVKCGKLMEQATHHYFGLTGLSISYVFVL